MILGFIMIISGIVICIVSIRTMVRILKLRREIHRLKIENLILENDLREGKE